MIFSRFTITGFLAGICFLVHAGSAAETTDDDPFAELEGPMEVELDDGRVFDGRAVALRDDVLYLRQRLPDGEIDRGFRLSRISSVQFPGKPVEDRAYELLEAELWREAIPVVEALWHHRAPFLRLLDDEQLALLCQLPELHVSAGNPGRAIGLAEELLPHVSERDGRLFLQGVALRAHFTLELYPEAEQLAREWIERQGNFPHSALGWKVLADLALLEEDYDRAAWTAVAPIAFSGPFHTPYLAECYAIAIFAFHHLEEPERATLLGLEMEQHLIDWPDDDRFAEVRDLYSPTDEPSPSPTETTNEEDLDLRPPEADLNLPLKDVRKLISDTH